VTEHSDQAARTAETVELLQTMIRNACVNEGTAASGHETRNADALVGFFDGAGIAVETFDAAPGRTNLVARIEGSDPDAPSLCLNGHTDVVPANAEGWRADPFGGELIDGEIWGRGAVDMLNLTASMAVAFRHLSVSGFRPAGDLVFFGVADEEAGSAYGARWMAEHHPGLITTDYVLTENGGLHGSGDRPTVRMSAGEKGVAWRRLTFRGTPGHGSMPFKSDNALVKAAAAVDRIADYRPAPRLHELWRNVVAELPLDDDTADLLMDPARVDGFLDELPREAGAPFLYSCTHTTFSPNVAASQTKTNVLPDEVTIDVDIRTMPGDSTAEVEAHLREALGDLADHVEVEILMDDPASISRIDTPLWDSMQKAVGKPFPESELSAGFGVGFTDARVHRELGAIAYGAGLLSPSVSGADFASRFHGNDERIDVTSLGLTTQFWLDVVSDFLG